MVASLFLTTDVIGGSTEEPFPGSQAGPAHRHHSSTLDSHSLMSSRPTFLSCRLEDAVCLP